MARSDNILYPNNGYFCIGFGFEFMRKSTEDIYRQKIGEIVDHISANIHNPLALSDIARVTGVSQRQLHRIMNEYLNESPAGYITRQRMERAVMYMQTTEIALPELAGMTGYDNPQSFSKAFKRYFGISPKMYLIQLKDRLKKRVQAGSGMNMSIIPEIIEEPNIDLIYTGVIGKYGDPEPYDQAWQNLIRYAKENDLLFKETRFMGISFDDPNVTKQDKCRFYACASVKEKIKPVGEIGYIMIPGGKYAVFTYRGSYSRLQYLYDEISVNFTCELRHGVSYEEYISDPAKTPEADLITKIFIPIK